MNRKEFTKNLISQFEQNIGKLSDEVLSEIEAGNLVISLVPKLAESGGITSVGFGGNLALGIAKNIGAGGLPTAKV
jgi:hypothetical protein